ncbi:restriction endonuclease subunit S, partial [Acidiphilium sp.]|uniref:restriction endonuclease subunit S n=1 Tax=Acidiphilium sp. TaxID=527 RepID=UPI003D008FE3
QQLLTGKTRLPGFTGAWSSKLLGEISSLYQPATISAQQLKEVGFPVYGANGIVGFYDRANHEKWQITITCRGSTCGTVNRTVDKCWITGNAMVVNVENNPHIDKVFLYHLLKSQDFNLCITGSGQPQIVRTPLKMYPLAFPSSKNEQSAIAAILSDMDAELAGLESQRDKARAIKQGMMQELLTGRIRLI